MAVLTSDTNIHRYVQVLVTITTTSMFAHTLADQCNPYTYPIVKCNIYTIYVYYAMCLQQQDKGKITSTHECETAGLCLSLL